MGRTFSLAIKELSSDRQKGARAIAERLSSLTVGYAAVFGVLFFAAFFCLAASFARFVVNSCSTALRSLSTSTRCRFAVAMSNSGC